ncbi:MAG: hypothetical protein ACLU4N_08485 [Butyricimonas faecihominis]
MLGGVKPYSWASPQMASIAPVSRSAACVKPSGTNVVSRRNMKYVTMIKMKRLVRVGAIVPAK